MLALPPRRADLPSPPPTRAPTIKKVWGSGQAFRLAADALGGCGLWSVGWQRGEQWLAARRDRQAPTQHQIACEGEWQTDADCLGGVRGRDLVHMPRTRLSAEKSRSTPARPAKSRTRTRKSLQCVLGVCFLAFDAHSSLWDSSESLT
eukprot:453344-Rhodomonas_salina.1